MSSQYRIPGLVFFTLIIFVLLLAVEVLVLTGLDGHLPNTISSPFYDFRHIAAVVWKQNPWEITQEWFVQPALEIGFTNEESGLYSWAIYYHWPAILSHLIVALASALYLSRPLNKAGSAKDVALLTSASLLIITSTFYLSIAAHCSGSTWIVNVIIRAMQSSAVNASFMLQKLAVDVPAMFTAIQWAMVAAGIFFYFILYRRDASTHQNQ